MRRWTQASILTVSDIAVGIGVGGHGDGADGRDEIGGRLVVRSVVRHDSHNI
jgi:hypothetical protein